MALEEVATQVAVQLDGAQAHLPDGDGRRAQRAAAADLTDLSTRDAEALLEAARQARARRAALPAVRRPRLQQRRQARAPHQPAPRRRAAARVLHARRGRHDDRGAAPRAPAQRHDRRRRRASCRPSSRSRRRASLVRRSRERLEMEIERFVVAEHDNAIIGCAALYAFPEERSGELAALAVHPDFRREGYGEALMHEIEARARKLKLDAPLRPDDAHVAMVSRARVQERHDRRAAATEAGALQLPAQVAGLLQEPLGAHHGAHGSLRQARPRGRRDSTFRRIPASSASGSTRTSRRKRGRQWLRHQTMLVNENRLWLADARARKWLAEQMEQHFFGGGAEMPSGYVPPSV